MGLMYPRLHGVLAKPAVPLSQDLWALYEFEDSGNLGLDTQGNLDLTNINGVTQVAGKIGFASQADATLLQHFEGPMESGDFDLNASSYSFAFWGIMLNAHESGSHTFVGSRSTSQGNLSMRTGNSDTYYAQLSGQPQFTDKRFGPYDETTWHHYVMIKTGNAIVAYVDNTLLADTGFDTITTVNQAAGSVLRLFRGNSIYSTGTIDQVAIWTRGLTSGDVAELYNSGNGVVI